MSRNAQATASPPVLLVNPNRMQPPVAPIALDYLAHSLGEHGLPVEVLDLCFSPDPETDIASYLAQREVSLVAVTLRNTDDTYFASQDFFLPGFREVVAALKRHTPAPTVLGGAGFSVMPEAILDYCGLDLGIWGEGEAALPLLAERLAAPRLGAAGGEISGIPGLVYRHGGGFRHNPPAYLDLERATSRVAVDNRRYFREGAMCGVETKRGCPRRCIYCADPVGKGRRTRLRSPRSVAEEVAALVAQGIDHLHLCDSEFNIPEAHSRAVATALIERGLGDRVRWYTYASPAPFSDELARLWLQAGCAGVDFGVDSGYDPMLRALGRDFTVAQVAHTAEVCHRQGLTFMYDLLLGGPGETPASLQETVEVMKRLEPDRVGASLGVRLFPGTPLAEMIRQEGDLAANPNLQGAVTGNPGFLSPVFYVAAALGDDPLAYLHQLIGGDERFFTASRGQEAQDYNYNQNEVLVQAIQGGYRGAFWDILRRFKKAPSR